MKGRDWIAVALGLGLAAGMGVLAEGMVRWGAKDACMQADALLGFSLKHETVCVRRSRDFKVSYKINSWGLRDNEFTQDKSANVKRILLLGDSFTEGTGVNLEDTFSERVEAETGFEVINAGVSGYSTLHEYLWFKERGLKLKPDLVILNVNATDFVEAAKYHQVWQDSAYTNLQTKKILFWRLPFLREYLARLRRPQSRNSTVFVTPEQYWPLVRSDIARINFLSRGRGVPLLVVWQPHGHQVSATAWSEGRAAHGFELGRKYPTEIPKWIGGLAQELDLDFLDLSLAFEATDATKLYFPYDGHWTIAGHNLAAQAIGEYLHDRIF